MSEPRYRVGTADRADWPILFEPIWPIHISATAEVVRWCREEYGPSWSDLFGDMNGARWVRTLRGQFLFRSDRDAVAFRLRWC